MTDRIRRLALPPLLGMLLVVSGCVSMRELAGFPAESTLSVNIQRPTKYWVLIKNPRYGDVASEPEYIWVEENKIPTTFRSMMFGKNSVLAPPEVVAQYGSPPRGGRISSLQGAAATTAATSGVSPITQGKANVPVEVTTRRGYVVYVDTTRVVVDLTAKDGVRPGTMVSLRRDKVQIVHPVSGELLGELDEEVGTAKVVEVREKFSVPEIQAVHPGRADQAEGPGRHPVVPPLGPTAALETRPRR